MEDPAPLTGEPLALDLVNTRPRAGGGQVDHIGSPEGLAAWLALEAERLAEPLAEEATPADLAAVHAVRDHAAAAIEAARQGKRPPPGALSGLNRAQGAAPAVKRLAWDGTAVAATARRTGPFGVRLAACLAEAAADLLADPAIAKVQGCEAEDCSILFLPANPRRRWCSAARCGNRIRVARYYNRHKGP